MSEWRNDKASDAQIKRLKAEGLKYEAPITKGAASDLIGTTEPASYKDVEVLKYFKVKDVSDMNQTEARGKVDELLSAPETLEKWKNRPATKDQKDIYNFFEIPIPKGLKYKNAKSFISELFEDDEKQEAWDNHEDLLEERESWFEDQLEMFNDDRVLYDCKKISKRLFREIVESLEAEGHSLEDIEKDEESFFRRTFRVRPSLNRERASKGYVIEDKKPINPGFKTKKEKKKTSLTTYMVIIVVSVILLVKIVGE